LEPFKIPAVIEIADAAHHGARFKKARVAAIDPDTIM
jgi:hypothetical protein